MSANRIANLTTEEYERITPALSKCAIASEASSADRTLFTDFPEALGMIDADDGSAAPEILRKSMRAVITGLTDLETSASTFCYGIEARPSAADLRVALDGVRKALVALPPDMPDAVARNAIAVNLQRKAAALDAIESDVALSLGRPLERAELARAAAGARNLIQCFSTVAEAERAIARERASVASLAEIDAAWRQVANALGVEPHVSFEADLVRDVATQASALEFEELLRARSAPAGALAKVDAFLARADATRVIRDRLVEAHGTAWLSEDIKRLRNTAAILQSPGHARRQLASEFAKHIGLAADQANVLTEMAQARDEIEALASDVEAASAIGHEFAGVDTDAEGWRTALRRWTWLADGHAGSFEESFLCTVLTSRDYGRIDAVLERLRNVVRMESIHRRDFADATLPLATSEADEAVAAIDALAPADRDHALSMLPRLDDLVKKIDADRIALAEEIERTLAAPTRLVDRLTGEVRAVLAAALGATPEVESDHLPALKDSIAPMVERLNRYLTLAQSLNTLSRTDLVLAATPLAETADRLARLVSAHPLERSRAAKQALAELEAVGGHEVLKELISAGVPALQWTSALVSARRAREREEAERVESERRKIADEANRVAEAARVKAENDVRQQVEYARLKTVEEARKAADDAAAKRWAEEDARRLADTARLKSEADARRERETARQKAAEESRLAAEAARVKTSEEMRIATEAAKRRADDAARALADGTRRSPEDASVRQKTEVVYLRAVESAAPVPADESPTKSLLTIEPVLADTEPVQTPASQETEPVGETAPVDSSEPVTATSRTPVYANPLALAAIADALDLTLEGDTGAEENSPSGQMTQIAPPPVKVSWASRLAGRWGSQPQTKSSDWVETPLDASHAADAPARRLAGA